MTQSPEHRRYVRMAAASNKKARRLGRGGTLTPESFGRAFVRSGGECPYCGVGIDPMHCSFDHIVPFELGGLNTEDNITACCLTCQRQKSTKMVDEFKLAQAVESVCEICGKRFKPRWADWRRGYGRTCSRVCAGVKGGETRSPAPSVA